MTRVALMLLDNHYGPDRRVKSECEALAAAGGRTRILAWDRRPDATDDVLDENGLVCVERLAVPAPRGGGVRAIWRCLVFTLRALRRAPRLPDVGVVVAHDVYLLPLGALLSRLLKAPLVYDAHEEFAAMEGGRYPAALLWAVTKLETAWARRARLVVVPGESRMPRWQRVGLSPFVFPNIGAGLTTADQDGGGDDRPIDLVYCGSLMPARRVDLLIELARRRPDLHLVIAGAGRMESEVAKAAAAIPNLEMRGWVKDPDALIAQAKAVYYGLDPEHTYSDKACPNTLYQALRTRTPILYFGGGEIAYLTSRYAIATQVEASVDGVEKGLDQICATVRTEWQFDDAIAYIAEKNYSQKYAETLRDLAMQERQA